MSNLPEWLQEGIERELASFKMTDLQRAAEELLFTRQFLPRADSQFNKTILDFTVSKTNPKYYE